VFFVIKYYAVQEFQICNCRSSATVSQIQFDSLLFVPTNAHIHTYIYITILNDITNAPTCFGAFAPPSGSFDIVFAKIIKY
jgi:hypothetical protein